MSSDEAPFFIVGNDRSGTTMLRLILDRSPDVAIPPESFFLADFAATRASGELDDPDRAREFADQVWEHPKVRLWGVGERPEWTDGSTGEAAYRDAVAAPFRAYATAHGKPRWADKTPPYLQWIDELRMVWPRAKFVILVRDGRDVALSIRGLPFGANNVWAAARDWAHGIRLGLRAQRQHPAHTLTVRYEDLVADPATVVPAICSFVGIDFEQQMLAIEKSSDDKIVADQAGWFENLWAGINAGSVGKWRTKMSRRQRRIFARVASVELAALDYDTDDEARTDRGPALPAAAHATHDFGLKLVHFVQLRIVQERGRELGYAVRRKLRRR